MTNRNKQLGTGLEDRVVERARKVGLGARKQPGSGVFPDYPSDAVIQLAPSIFHEHELLVECKVRSKLPSMQEMITWLTGVMRHAVNKKFLGAILVFNLKGSRYPMVLMDLNLLLMLLSQQRQQDPDA